MNDVFEKRVRAAAVAGWWVILLAFALLLVTWVAYLAITSARPEWVLRMWEGISPTKGVVGNSCKPYPCGSWAHSNCSSGF
jgi:hypothetical protein